MKTICPYCKQEFPDTPDEYLETTVTCSVCNKNFIAKKAKFCSECGAISPGQAIKCAQCGYVFPGNPDAPSLVLVSPSKNRIPESVVNGSTYEEADDDDCFFEDVTMLTAWSKFTSNGRAGKKEFIVSLLQYVILLVIINYFQPRMSLPVSAVAGLLGIFIFAFTVILCVRRLHDIGLSGWWWLLWLLQVLLVAMLCPLFPALIPFGQILSLGGFFVLLCIILPSQPGRNKYGPNPIGVGSDGNLYTAGKWFLKIMLYEIVVMLALLIIGALA